MCGTIIANLFLLLARLCNGLSSGEKILAAPALPHSHSHFHIQLSAEWAVSGAIKPSHLFINMRNLQGNSFAPLNSIQFNSIWSDWIKFESIRASIKGERQNWRNLELSCEVELFLRQWLQLSQCSNKWPPLSKSPDSNSIVSLNAQRTLFGRAIKCEHTNTRMRIMTVIIVIQLTSTNPNDVSLGLEWAAEK